MNVGLQIFIQGIENLDQFLDSIEIEAKLLDSLYRRQTELKFSDDECQFLTSLTNTNSEKKRNTYSVAIISLYGLLEQFIDDQVGSYVSRVSKRVSLFSELPEQIQKNHTKFSISLLEIAAEPWYRGKLSQEQIAGNLHSCFIPNGTYHLNNEAFPASRRVNVRVDQITKMLGEVGITEHLRKVFTYKNMYSLFSNTYPADYLEKLEPSELKTLFVPIDDLVERRNEIAHGIQPDEIESIDLIKNRCNFIKAYGQALNNLFLSELVYFELKNPICQKLGHPIKVFNNEIVCFDSDNCTIAVDNIIIAITRNALKPYLFSQVQSIQINKIDHEVVTITTATSFGIRVSFHAKETYEYFILPSGTL